MVIMGQGESQIKEQLGRKEYIEKVGYNVAASYLVIKHSVSEDG